MIFRFDVRSGLMGEGNGEGLRREIAELGIEVGDVAVSRVFLIDVDAEVETVRSVVGKMVADPDRGDRGIV